METTNLSLGANSRASNIGTEPGHRDGIQDGQQLR